MSNNVTCPNCRLVNFATEQFCRNCRTPLIATTNQPSMAEARFAAGLDFLNRGQYREALDAFIYTIQANYYPAESYYYLSQAYAALGYTKEAEEAYYRGASLKSSYVAPAAVAASPAVENVEYAGFWIRFLGNFVDGIMMMVISFILTFMVFGYDTTESTEPPTIHPLYILISNILSMAAIIFCWLRWSASPGKMIVQAQIVDEKTGGKPSTGQMVGRYFAYFLSILPFGYGFIRAAFSKKKQTWHDQLAGTVVIRTRKAYNYGYSSQSTQYQSVEQKSQLNPILGGLLVFLVVGIIDVGCLRIIKTSERVAKLKNRSTERVSERDLYRVPEVKPVKAVPVSIPPRLPYYAYLALDSDKDHHLGAGDYKKFTPEDAKITASVTKEGLVVISVQGSSDLWEIELAAPGGSRINKETYEGVESNSGPNSSKPILNLKRNGKSCGTATSRFDVSDIAYNSNNELDLFDATFEQHCEGTQPALYGRVHFSNKPEDKPIPASIPPPLDKSRYISLTSDKAVFFNSKLYHHTSERIYISDEDHISSLANSGGTVNFRYFGGVEGFVLSLIPAEGTKLTPGTYDQIEMRPTGNNPGLDLTITNAPCYQGKGRLVIEKIIYGKDDIDLLDATFERQCPESKATVYCRIHFDKR